MKRDYVKYVKDELGERWFRFTPQREKIAKYIAGHKGIFSADQVGRKLKEVDRASIYRTLRLFAELDLIHPVLTLREKEYYEAHSKRHHHHEICTRCGRTACIACPLSAQAGLSKTKSKILKTKHHTYAVTGLCKSCA
jgi:Fur family transcriptional regulator, ferric uptake regulator